MVVVVRVLLLLLLLALEVAGAIGAAKESAGEPSKQAVGRLDNRVHCTPGGVRGAPHRVRNSLHGVGGHLGHAGLAARAHDHPCPLVEESTGGHQADAARAPHDEHDGSRDVLLSTHDLDASRAAVLATPPTGWSR